jgi:hypothetical protein
MLFIPVALLFWFMGGAYAWEVFRAGGQLETGLIRRRLLKPRQGSLWRNGDLNDQRLRRHEIAALRAKYRDDPELGPLFRRYRILSMGMLGLLLVVPMSAGIYAVLDPWIAGWLPDADLVRTPLVVAGAWLLVRFGPGLLVHR